MVSHQRRVRKYSRKFRKCLSKAVKDCHKKHSKSKSPKSKYVKKRSTSWTRHLKKVMRSAKKLSFKQKVKLAKNLILRK